MAKSSKKSHDRKPETAGALLRTARVDGRQISIRDMAKRLDIAPIHVSDIETGKRNPSEELLVKIATEYGVSLAELRAGFERPDGVVAEVANESAIAAEKVPQFLRTARGLNAAQWDRLIQQAKRVSSEKES